MTPFVTRRSRCGLVSCLIMATALAGLHVAQTAYSQSFPTKPIRMIVPFSPGGPTDVLARTIGDRLGAVLGQPVAVDNKPGATGAIGLGLLARAEPDGYTIGLGSSGSMSMYPSVNRDLPWDPVKDFAPISYLGNTQLVLLVNPSSKISSVTELVAAAKAEPGKLTYATGGHGGSQHLATALLEDLAGISLRHVPYKGSNPAMLDVVGGRVDMMFDGVSVLPHVKAGKLRAIAVSGTKEVRTFPGVPTIASTLPTFDVSVWFGLFAPAKTPGTLIDRYNKALAQVLREPAVAERIEQLGMDVLYSSPQQLEDDLRQEIEKWRRVVRQSNITAN